MRYNSNADLDKPIFIGGAGRSGTSLLRTILDSHPRIFIGAELKVIPEIARFRQRMTRYAAHLDHYFDIDKRALNDTFAQFIISLLHRKHKKSGKPRVGEKTPNNVFVFHHLHQIFPNSPLLHIIRDGRDVVRSLLEQEWTNATGEPLPITNDPKAAAEYWVNAVIAGRRAAQRFPTLADKYLEIRYEDLVNETEDAVRTIIDHVDETWAPEILTFHKRESSVYQQVYRPISDQSVGKWTTQLSKEQKEIVKDVAGDLLIELGYAEDLNW
jgi:hypothetical protein